MAPAAGTFPVPRGDSEGPPALVSAAAVLAALQALTPRPPPNLVAVLFSAAGAGAAALLAEFIIRTRRCRAKYKAPTQL